MSAGVRGLHCCLKLADKTLGSQARPNRLRKDFGRRFAPGIQSFASLLQMPTNLAIAGSIAAVGVRLASLYWERDLPWLSSQRVRAALDISAGAHARTYMAEERGLPRCAATTTKGQVATIA